MGSRVGPGRVRTMAGAALVAAVLVGAGSGAGSVATAQAHVAGAGHLPTIGNAIAAYADGGTVVAGRSLEVRSSLRPLVVSRHARDGATVWSRTFDRLAGDTQWPLRVLTDGPRTLVVGTARRGGSDDGFVLALDEDGGTGWTAWITSRDGRREVLNGAAIGPDGSVIAVGRTEGLVGAERTAPEGTDALAARVDADGSVVWAEQFGEHVAGVGGVESEFRDVVLAPDGRILAVAGDRCSGRAWCAGREATFTALVLDHRGALGAVVRRPLSEVLGDAGGGAAVSRVVAGPSGPVVVATRSGATGCLLTATLDWDLGVRRRSGPLLCGPGEGVFGHDGAVAVTEDGRIVLGTASDYGVRLFGDGPGGLDLVVAVVDPDGEVLEGVQHGGAAGDRVESVAIDADGVVHVVGHAGEGATSLGLPATARPTGVRFRLEPAAPAGPHRPDPAPTWTSPVTLSPGAWAGLPAVVPGRSDGPLTGAAGLLTQHGSERIGLIGPVLHPIGTDLLLAGWERGEHGWDVPHLVVERRAADGGTVWRTAPVGLTGTPDVALTIDVRGDRIVVGGATHAAPRAGFVVALGSDGTERWVHRIGAGADSTTRVDDLVLLADGAVVAVGGTTGAVVSEARSDGGFAAIAVRLDGDGDVDWTVQHATSDPRRYVGVDAAPDATLIVRGLVQCRPLTPCEDRPASTPLLRLRAGDGAVTEEVDLPVMELLEQDPNDTYRDVYPWLTVDGQAPHPDGLALTATVLRPTGEQCLVVALVGWDLAPRWAGPRLLCDGGPGLAENRGVVAVGSDGRFVAVVSTAYEGALGGPSAGATDLVTVVLDRTGDALDAVQVGGPATDHATGVAILADGGVRIAATTGAGVTTFGAPADPHVVGEIGTLSLATPPSGAYLRAPGVATLVGRAGVGGGLIGPGVRQPGGVVVGGAIAGPDASAAIVGAVPTPASPTSPEASGAVEEGVERGSDAAAVGSTGSPDGSPPTSEAPSEVAATAAREAPVPAGARPAPDAAAAAGGVVAPVEPSSRPTSEPSAPSVPSVPSRSEPASDVGRGWASIGLSGEPLGPVPGPVALAVTAPAVPSVPVAAAPSAIPIGGPGRTGVIAGIVVVAALLPPVRSLRDVRRRRGVPRG